MDLIPRFARPIPHLNMIANTVTDIIFNRFEHLENLDPPWLSPQRLKLSANAIHNRGGTLDNCKGFVDGTARPICRLGRNKRVVYNGHRIVHAVKFRSVVAPNGLITNLNGLLREDDTTVQFWQRQESFLN